MVYGRYNELVNGVYKPTYNWGAPSCSHFFRDFIGVSRCFKHDMLIYDVQNPCCLMIRGGFTTKYIGDYHDPLLEILLL